MPVYLPVNGKRLSLWIIGAVAAALFGIAAGTNLTSQGFYYDELHQTTGAFMYLGKSPTLFCRLHVEGIPILNTSYGGALKTGIYGMYLKITGAGFSPFSWRILGILFVSSGIFLFTLMTAQNLSRLAALLLFALFLTDINVVLAARFDYGPVALSMLFRLLIIGAWMKAEMQGRVSGWNSFLIGAMVGLSFYDKLSSSVIIFPVVLIFLMDRNRWSLRHIGACAGGFVLGSLPLSFANLYTLIGQGYLVSLADVQDQVPFFSLPVYIFQFFTLGRGTILRSVMMGSGEVLPPDALPASLVECLLLAVILAMVVTIILYFRHHDKLFRMAGCALLCYLVVGIGLYALPNVTSVHHWIIATPFQYLAICLAFMGISRLPSETIPRATPVRTVFSIVLIVFVLSRIVGLVSLEKAFIDGDASHKMDPSLTTLGLFASKKSDDAVFIAADWGVATQIICFANGKPDLVYELFGDYKGPDQLKWVSTHTGKKTVYLVHPNPFSGVNPANTKRIIEDMETLPGWEEISVENEVADLDAVIIRKFQKR